MHNTLVVNNTSPEIERLYSLNLFTWVNSRITPKDNIEDAIEYLKITKEKVDLVVYRYKDSKQSNLTELKEKLAELDKNYPVVVIGVGKGEVKEFQYIESILDIKDFVKYCAIKLNTTAASMADLKVPDYFPIPTEFFSYITSPSEDIYKLVEDEYEIIFAEHDEYTPGALDNILDDYEHPFFFVKSEDRLHFVSYLSQEIVHQISFKDLKENEQITATEMSQFLLSKKLKKLGVTPETVSLAKRNIEFMVTSSKTSPTVSSLLKRLMSNKSGYLYKHSQILIFVCLHIMNFIEWGSEEQKKSISFIAFFHDICLETDEQAQIHSQEQLDDSKLAPKEKRLVMQHAQKAAEIVQKYPKAPMGVDAIIRQHHGIAHGIGFSEYFSGNLSPMSVLFILAEDFTDEILRTSPEFNIKAKIKKMRDVYPTQRFKKIIDILESMPI